MGCKFHSHSLIGVLALFYSPPGPEWFLYFSSCFSKTDWFLFPRCYCSSEFEADHLTLSSSKIMNVWTSTPPIRLHCDMIRHMDNCILVSIVLTFSLSVQCQFERCIWNFSLKTWRMYVDWFRLDQDGDQRQDVVNIVMRLWFPYMTGNLIDQLKAISFFRRS